MFLGKSCNNAYFRCTCIKANWSQNLILNSEKFYAIFFLHYKLHCVIVTFTLLKCKCKSWTWLLAYACVKKKRGLTRLTRLTSTTKNSKSRIYLYILSVNLTVKVKQHIQTCFFIGCKNGWFIKLSRIV